MTNCSLFDEKALKKRIYVVYNRMAQRAKPRLFKSGRRSGQIRIPGLSRLPFTREELWQHALNQLGSGAIRCPYCVEIGRPANIITLSNCVFDHKVPAIHAGRDLDLLRIWSLENIVAVCADCNNLKGKLSYAFFIGLMAAIERWGDHRDRDSVYACLRTHGVTLQGFRDKRKPSLPISEFAPAESQALALTENW